MSIPEYQRAMADLLRSPSFCRSVRASEESLAAYGLNNIERQRLQEAAKNRGMQTACMLYRASRLVGITRRLPATVQLLGPSFRYVFDAFVKKCVDAPSEFDQEAHAFATFLKPRLREFAAQSTSTFQYDEILATLAAEEAGIEHLPKPL